MSAFYLYTRTVQYYFTTGYLLLLRFIIIIDSIIIKIIIRTREKYESQLRLINPQTISIMLNVMRTMGTCFKTYHVYQPCEIKYKTGPPKKIKLSSAELYPDGFCITVRVPTEKRISAISATNKLFSYPFFCIQTVYIRIRF